MKHVPLFSVILMTLISAVNPANSATSGDGAAQTETGIVSYLSGASYITKDIDASVDFYTNYFGFVEKKRVELDSDGTRAVFGLAEGETVIYAALAPVNFSKERADFTGLNFVQIKGQATTLLANDKARKPMFGEPIMAFSVTQLKETYAKMQASGVTIIDPIKTSPSGKSMTVTVLDPNGIRVQLYEIFKVAKDN